MDVKNDILEELRSVSEVVATISRQTPYQAPEGYFAEVPGKIMQQIASWSHAKSLKFSVPEGYFEGFAQQVLNRIKGSKGDLTGVEGREYEEALPAVLVQAGRRTPYQAPEGYFEGLAPILAVVKDKNPYLVPEGYFERFPGELGGRTAERALTLVQVPVAETGKVRRMNWWKYSAAAVIAGLILTIGWLRWFGMGPGHPGGNSQSQGEIARTMSKVSDEALKNYLADQDTTLAQPIENLAASASLDMNDSDVKDLLGNVSDGELRQYMEEHGEAMDMATN